MTTLNISLPDAMKAFVEAQVQAGQYASASDYIRALVREDQKRQAEDDLDEQAMFIARDNPVEALAFLDAVEQAFARLVDYPNIGSARAFRLRA